jgi:hypothetical protein
VKKSRVLASFVVASLVATTHPDSALATDRVWFGPNPGIPGILPLPGMQDYWNIFTPGSPWPIAMNRVGVFKFWAQTIDNSSDAQLSNAFGFLQNNDIKIALSVGPVEPPPGCGWRESYGNRQQLGVRLARIQELGGVVSYLEMDEPFLYSYYWSAGSCRLSPVDLAWNVAQTAVVLHQYFPLAEVGEVEAFQVMNYGGLGADYDLYLSTLQTALATLDPGMPGFTFVHNEGDVELSDWQQTEYIVRPLLQARNIKYGLIRHGMNAGARTNAAWVQAALWRIGFAKDFYTNTYASGIRGPVHNIFDSWDGYPTAVMPESSPDTFASLINSMGVLLTIDTPGPLYVSQGANIGGWALDRSAVNGPGVDTIHVYDASTTPWTFAGTTTVASRPDVAAVYGPQYSNSGWNFWVALPLPGPHLYCFIPHSAVTGHFEWTATRCLSVQGIWQ